MPNTFPTLSSGACFVQADLSGQPIAKYPIQVKNEWLTRTIRFVADTEQRWVVRPQLATITMQYKSVLGYDVARIMEFFKQRTGRYVDIAYLNTFSITVHSDTYDYCVFDQDSINVVESPENPNYFDFVIRIKQLRPN